MITITRAECVWAFIAEEMTQDSIIVRKSFLFFAGSIWTFPKSQNFSIAHIGCHLNTLKIVPNVRCRFYMSKKDSADFCVAMTTEYSTVFPFSFIKSLDTILIKVIFAYGRDTENGKKLLHPFGTRRILTVSFQVWPAFSWMLFRRGVLFSKVHTTFLVVGDRSYKGLTTVISPCT